MADRRADQQQAVEINQLWKLEQQHQQAQPRCNQQHRLKQPAHPRWTPALAEDGTLGNRGLIAAAAHHLQSAAAGHDSSW